MKNDEFNVEKITNEKDGFSSFEFGHTQNSDSSSFLGNKNSNKDEVNEASTSNTSKTSEKKKENKSQEEIIKSSTSTSTSATSTSTTTLSNLTSSIVAPVTSVSLVTLTTISALVGFNIYSHAKVVMNDLQAGIIEVSYNLELQDVEDTTYVISLENKEYEFLSYQELSEGINKGIFTDLMPGCTYTISVLDWNNNLSLYQTAVTTLYYSDQPIIDDDNPLTHTVTFFIPGGYEDTETQVVVDHGGYVTKPEDPRKNGYIFKGWSKDSSDISEFFDFDNIPITRDISLYAIWDDITNYEHYEVSFDTVGGSYIEMLYALMDECVIKPEDPTRDGYIFQGWALDSEETERYYTFEEPLNENTTLYAVWEERGYIRPTVYNFNWNHTIDLETNTIYYSVEYDDPDRQLVLFKCYVYYEDPYSKNIYEANYYLPFTSTTYSTVLPTENGENFTFATDAIYHFEISYTYDGDQILISQFDTQVLDCYERKSTLIDYNLRRFNQGLSVTLESQDDWNLFPYYEGTTTYIFYKGEEKIEVSFPGLRTQSVDISEYDIDLEATYDYQLVYSNEEKGTYIVLAEGSFDFANSVNEVSYLYYYG